jgi:hypothetical protein
MALDADVFADLMESYYQSEMETAFPRVVKGRVLESEALEDGSYRYTITDQIGPVEVDREKIRPMCKAIGRAIVEFLNGYAEVPINDVAIGAVTRVGRIQ